MTTAAQTDRWLVAMPIVFVLIWSTGFIVARYGMPHGPPFQFLAIRFALSVLCFLPWVWFAGSRWPATPVQWRHLAITGLLMHAGYLGGVWAAVKAGMGSGVAALVVGLQPVLTAVWLSARERRCMRASGPAWHSAWPAWCWSFPARSAWAARRTMSTC